MPTPLVKRLPELLLALTSGVLYLLTISPDQGWLDQSEFIAGAHTLGVVHPPGHPLYILPGKAFALLLPFGSIGFRVNLISAVFGVACGLLVCAIVRRIGEQLDTEKPAVSWMAAGAGLFFCVTDACWLQSVRAEVYTLNCALVLVAIWLAVRWLETPRRALVYAAIVALGLGLCNHHYLVFFFFPAPLLMLLITERGRALLSSRALVHMLLLGALCLLAYAYLPLRAQAEPAINWGDPTTVERFVDTLSARTFQGSVSEQARSAPLGDNVAVATGMLADQLGGAGLLFGLLGLVMLLLRSRPLGVLLLVALITNVLTKAIMLIDPKNPDDYGYFLLSVAVLCVGLGLVGSLLAERARGMARRGVAWVGAAGVLLGAAGMANAVMPTVDRSRDRSAEAFVDTTLDRVEPDSVVLVNFYSVFFNHWYAQLVNGRRPDVVLVHATFDSKRYDGVPYVAQLQKRWPKLEPVWGAYLRSMRFPEEALRRLARERPVYVEPLPEAPPGARRQEASGLVRRLEVDPGNDAEAAARDRRVWADLVARVYIDGEPSRDAKNVLSWFTFIGATLNLRQGLPRTAAEHLARAPHFGESAKMKRAEPLAIGLMLSDDAARRATPTRRPFRALQRDVRAALFEQLRYLSL